MMYQLTSSDSHLDFGFGITGESYYDSAQFLDTNRESIQAMQLVELPINFCYRHSIELFLKSLVIIFHKKLGINYDDLPPESLKPMINTNGKWRPLYTCHWIDELYQYWKNSLLLPNIKKLQSLAPEGQWEEDIDISGAIKIISKYDRNSSFFRYPVTEDKNLDLKKFTIQKTDIESLNNLLINRTINTISEDNESDIDNTDNITDKKVAIDDNKIKALIDINEEVPKVYIKKSNQLEHLNNALRLVANYFYCYHIMARCTLCEYE